MSMMKEDADLVKAAGTFTLDTPDAWPSWTDEASWGLGDEDPGLMDRTTALAGLVEQQAAIYRGWPNEVGAMLAGAMDELALKVRMTAARTPAEYQARVDVLDREARAAWEDAGYDAGFAAGRASCRCDQAGTAFGHQA